jgi:predicted transcriptional regulator
MSDSSGRLLDLTAAIVSAHVGNNSTQSDNVSILIQNIYLTLRNLENGGAGPEMETPVPAVPIKKSVFPDHIVCLEDGKKLKMLKRHLATSYKMTPDDYRRRWNLPPNYPMVAPDYAKQRSMLARKIGLGRKSTAKTEVEPVREPAIVQIPEKKHGRKAKNV